VRTASQWLVIFLTFASVHLAEAQQPGKMPRIGFLIALDENRLKAFRQGLHDQGYIEGKNILIEYRYAQGNERIPGLVAELVQLELDVLVVGPIAAIRAAKQATKTIPIVMVTVVDPVASGLIDSLARPEGSLGSSLVFWRFGFSSVSNMRSTCELGSGLVATSGSPMLCLCSSAIFVP
jgi:ABC-type uncharacterized transport system substrate-binding protein